MKSSRRNVLKGAGGALTVGALGGTASGGGAETDEADKTMTQGDWNDELLANCWMHSGGTTPFRGAHGHREWSPWSLERRAEGLAEVGFNAIGLFHEDIRYRIEHEFTEGDRTARLQQMDEAYTRAHDAGMEYL